MSIVTFYSYKGGVGRSMALANIAVLLARTGARVLVVDWDLEAPGIEEYFDGFQIQTNGRGLLPLLSEVSPTNRADYREHLWTLQSTSEQGTSLSVLQSGRAEPDYYPMLERFSQTAFFKNGGGGYLEQLRDEWNRDFDYVLIDSRTGLSDAGGVCTIFMPDVVVALFTATRQSVRGVRDVLTLAQQSRQRLDFDRSRISVIPVPSRVGFSSTGVDRWMDEFVEVVGEFFDDWMPVDVDRKSALAALAISHSSKFLHGARLAVHPKQMLPTETWKGYSLIARLLQSDLSDTKSFARSSAKQPAISPEAHEEPDYRYDLYVSSPSGGTLDSWVEDHLLPLIQEALAARLSRSLRVFFYRATLSSRGEFRGELAEALQSSRVLLALLSPQYFRSEWCAHEWGYFSSLELSEPGQSRIVPIVLRMGEFVEDVSQRQIFDFQRFVVVGGAWKESSDYVAFKRAVDDVAAVAAGLIDRTSRQRRTNSVALDQIGGDTTGQ